jgi:hypothetical protein
MVAAQAPEGFLVGDSALAENDLTDVFTRAVTGGAK